MNDAELIRTFKELLEKSSNHRGLPAGEQVAILRRGIEAVIAQLESRAADDRE